MSSLNVTALILDATCLLINSGYCFNITLDDHFILFLHQTYFELFLYLLYKKKILIWWFFLFLHAMVFEAYVIYLVIKFIPKSKWRFGWKYYHMNWLIIYFIYLFIKYFFVVNVIFVTAYNDKQFNSAYLLCRHYIITKNLTNNLQSLIRF